MIHQRQCLPLGLEPGQHALGCHPRLDEFQRHQPLAPVRAARPSRPYPSPPRQSSPTADTALPPWSPARPPGPHRWFAPARAATRLMRCDRPRIAQLIGNLGMLGQERLSLQRAPRSSISRYSAIAPSTRMTAGVRIVFGHRRSAKDHSAVLRCHHHDSSLSATGQQPLCQPWFPSYFAPLGCGLLSLVRLPRLTDGRAKGFFLGDRSPGSWEWNE